MSADLDLRRLPRSHFAPRSECALCDLDPAPASVAAARAFVRSALPEVGDDLAEVLLLLTSELVTNAVLHARTPLQVGVVADDDRVLVAVGDRVPDGGPMHPREHSGDRAGGRGLALVETLSAEWGCTPASDGKQVWFTLPRRARTPSPTGDRQARTASDSA